MKRTLSLILAALLLASSAVSCGKDEPAETNVSETKAVETTSPETSVKETIAPETDSPAPSLAYDPSLITENGIAKSHIVLFDGASDLEKTAADELAYHLKLVTGADVAVTNAVQSDSLPIIIATPDTLPELETLFPEDLDWLRVTSEKDENGRTRHWGDDGFAIRQHDGKIYIFGATDVGALNGTYDFIEETLGVIWVGMTETGIIYDEMPTIAVAKMDYREKSPFYIAFNNYGSTDRPHTLYHQRNKQYATDYPYGADCNVKDLVMRSPIYNPDIDEYWDTDANGNHLEASRSHNYLTYQSIGSNSSKQVNFWSQLTADTIAATVIADLDAFAASNAIFPKYYNVCMEDCYDPSVVPEMYEPFEYAPGEFVHPQDTDYIPTVYFTFINRIAKKVAEKYPDVCINTLAYMWAIDPPRCELEDNVTVWFAPLYGDFSQESYLVNAVNPEVDSSVKEAQSLIKWIEKGYENKIFLYNYYFCHYSQGWHERPLWRRIQQDFKDLAEAGFVGSTMCGGPSEGIYGYHGQQLRAFSSTYQAAFTYDDSYKMNTMSLWIYYKLMWNPWEDVDALIVEYCDKVYGEASELMQEYYALMELSWAEGSAALAEEFNMRATVENDPNFTYFYFLDFELDDGTYFLDAVRDVLDKAYEAADDKAKTFIEWPKKVYQDWTRFLN